MSAKKAAAAELRIPLPEEPGFEANGAFLAALRAVPPGATAVIEASACERMATPLVLMIVAAAAEFKAQGGALKIGAPTDAFTEAFERLGLFQQLMGMEFAA